jgi:hypothetical protein
MKEVMKASDAILHRELQKQKEFSKLSHSLIDLKHEQL